MSSINTLVGSDQFGGLVIVNRTADLGGGSSYEFAMLDPGPILCDFYVFNRTGTTTISGQHYSSDVAFDGTCDTIIGGPDPLTGTRLSTSAGTLAGEAPLDETQRTALVVRERVELGAWTPDETSAILLRTMGDLMRW